MRYVGFVALLLLSGCSKQTKNQKKKTRVVNAKTVRKSELIIPSTELSALALKQECAFLSEDSSSSKKTKKLSGVEQARQCEARLVDIPVPVATKPCNACIDATGKKMLAYTSTLPVDDVKRFYIEEMERFGWSQDYAFEGQELLLSFRKPQRHCAISVRPTRKNWQRSKNVAINVFVSA